MTRSKRYQHKSALVVITGPVNVGKRTIAKALEEELFKMGRFAYFLGIANTLLTEGRNTNDKTLARAEHVKELGEMAHVLTDAGLILLATVSDIDEYDLNTLIALNHPNPTLVVNVGGVVLSEKLIQLSLPAEESPANAANKILKVLNPIIELDPEFAI